VHEEVMMPAQEHTVRGVGASSVSIPMPDVVRLAPGRGSLARGEPASAITCGERDPLPRGEQPLIAADVEGLAGVVEQDRNETGRAGMAFDGGE